MSYEKLCMHCMQERSGLQSLQHECPHCHYREDTASQMAPYLPLRTMIGEKYLVGAVLETSGDSFTYMAYNTEPNYPVLLHEFFPSRIVNRTDTILVGVRSGKEQEYTALRSSYMELWSKLQAMQGLSALVEVLDILEENGTVYAISEYVEGSMTLRDFLLNSKKGYLSWENARVMFMPVLSTLSNLHSAGIIHRGISPATLMVYPDHKLRITGFCIPEGRTINSGLSAEVYPGYTPIEQLGLQSAAGPWTDIYSFAAVLYRALTGKTPVESTIRVDRDTMKIPANIAEELPDYVIRALINALQVYPEDRTRTIDAFRSELDGSQVAEMANEFREEEKARKRRIYEGRPDPFIASMVEEEEEFIEEPPVKGKRKKNSSGNSVTIIAVLLAVVAVAALVLVLLFGGKTFGFSGLKGETVQVPNFVGMEAENIEEQYGDSFNFNFKFEYSEDEEEGIVIRQSVNPGSEAALDTLITLTVSKGTEKITMPSVIGLTEDEAKALLEEAGFRVSTSTKDNDGSHNSGTVASATPSVGKACEKGTTCYLTVWGEAEETTSNWLDIFGGNGDGGEDAEEPTDSGNVEIDNSAA